MHRDEIIELLKNTLIMFAITLVAGGILGVVYEVTKAPIAVMEAEKRDEANKKVYPDAASFSEDILDKEAMAECLAGEYSGVEITEVLEARTSDDMVVGYVFEVTSHEGYGGDIVYRLGVQIDGTINGMSITSISDTPGLGMRAEEVIVPQFGVVRAEKFEVVKTGKIMDNQIDAISSATKTSKAIVKGVNGALEYLREVLKGGTIDEQ